MHDKRKDERSFEISVTRVELASLNPTDSDSSLHSSVACRLGLFACSRYTAACVCCVLQSSSRNNGWFNLNLPEWAGVRGQLEHLLVDGNPSSSGGNGGGPSSFGASSSLGGSGLLGSSSNPAVSSSSSASSSNAPVTSALIVLDLLMHSTLDPRQHVLLERWNIQHERHQAMANVTAARKADPGSTYKKLLLLVRSVYCFVKLLPAYAAWRLVQSASEPAKPSPPPFKMNHQLSSDHRSMERLQSEGWMNSSGVAPMIPQPIFDCSPRLFTFHSVATPLGKFTLSVLYRPDLSSIDFLQAAGMQIGQRISSTGGGNSAAQTSHQRGSSASSHAGHLPHSQSAHDGLLHPQLTSAGSEQIVMMENWMVAPETNNPNPRDQHAASHQGQLDPNATAQHQQQPVMPAQHPPKSALALSLEAVKKQRENSGNNAAQPQQQPPLDPRLQDRRHTLPPNSLYPQQPQSGQYPPQHQSHQHPSDGSGPRSERSASVFQQPQHHPSQQHPHSLPRDALFIPGGRGSSDQGVSEPLSSSKPMSIPRQQLGFVPSQPQQLTPQTHPPQQHTGSSHHHSPNSHSPSYSNSFTPPVPFGPGAQQQQHPHGAHSHQPSLGSTPHSYTGATAYSPFATAGQYLPPSSSSSSPGQHPAHQPTGLLPSSTSLTNLGSLLEETAEEEQNRRALLQSGTPPNAQQNMPQALYDNTPSSSQNIGGAANAYPSHSQQHSGLPAPSRLPHSISQPLGLSPQMRPQPSPGSISSSGSLPQPIPIPVSPFINPAATPGGNSRKNSAIFGSSPDGGFGAAVAPLTLGSSPLSSSYKGASSKPPLPSSGTSYTHTPFAASSRVTTSTSTFSSPAIGPQPAPPSSSGGIVIRERDAGSSSMNRFSGLNAAQALPPPKLGTSTPSPSGLSRALQQQQQGGSSFADSQQAQQHSGHMTALSLLSPGGAGGGAVHSVSPLSDTSHRGDSSSPSSISRPISIPIKPAPAPGGSGATISGSLQFGRTPPSIGAGSQTTLGLMQQQSAGLGMGPSPPTGLEAGVLGTSAGHRGSAQWLHSADVLGSSAGSGAPATGIQLNVAPFKASVPGRKASISGHSPVLAGVGTPSTPAQRVPIVPQTLPAFDLKAPASASDGVSGPSSIGSSPAVHHGFTPVSAALAPSSISHSGTFDPSHDFDGHEGDGLESFHTYLQNLQLQQEQKPALQLFAAESSDGASQRLPHSSISASPVPAGVSGSVSGSTSQLHVSMGGGGGGAATHSSLSSTMMGGVRHTTVQSLFDQLDRLQATTAAQQSSATPRN